MLKPSGCFQIQKIIGISTIHGNCKSYQVEWTPSWISGAHLIGCDELIEQFEEEQKENNANPFPDIHGSSVTDKEVMMVDNILQNNSAAGLQIKREREIQVSACTYTDSTFSPIPINHQGIVELKQDSLDSVVQQIAEGNADRSYVHRDFEGTKMDIENIQEDEEIDQKGSFTPHVIVNNYDTELVRSPLQDVQNLHDDDRREIDNPGILFGRNRVKTSNQNNGNDVNIRLGNLRESSIDKTLERGDEATKLFQCDICNIVFSNIVTLKEHLKLHRPVHQCQICFKSFSYEQCFEKHQLICIENSLKRKSVQNDDNKEPGTKIYLGENHSPGKLKDETELHNDTYQCIICCKTCGSKDKLNHHKIKMHSTCDICQKKFSDTDMEKVKLHIETHKTIKTDPLECSYCEKRFPDRTHVTIHERVHTGERPYKCGICHERFKQFQDFIVHLKIHDKKPT